MAALHNVGADAPGQTAPERTTNDEPRELAGDAGSKRQAQRVSLDSAAAQRRAQRGRLRATAALWTAAAVLWTVAAAIWAVVVFVVFTALGVTK